MATTRVFKSGNSMAVRLPASFGAVPGTPVEVREEQGRWIVETVAAMPRETIDWTGVWGSVPHMPLLTGEDRGMRPRDLDWGSKQLKARG